MKNQAGGSGDRMDRRALVRRHHPVIRCVDPLAPLSVGNGTFAFTVDITGLQTFPEAYREGIPLGTQSQWGWHTLPNPAHYTIQNALAMWNSQGRQVPYASTTQSDAGRWLRANPHRLGLARIGFEFSKDDGSPARLDEVGAIEQTLDLWNGVLTSRFEVAGHAVGVWTCCHPDRDLIAVSVESSLIAAGRLKVCFAFPYGSGGNRDQTDDWTHPEGHQTEIVERGADGIALRRTLDQDSYFVNIGHSGGCSFTRMDPHRYDLLPGRGRTGFSFTAGFSPPPIVSERPSAERTRQACETHWNRFWSTGGAMDLSDSRDPRAPELERRIVLSQYLTAIQCSGFLPPQETGLVFNSWHGKFHLEMHWWHGVHFAFWDRLPLFERSLSWYASIMPRARETAKGQGYAGVRWPKMVGPDGREGPSPIGPFLIWQQPHPIYYAELVYRARPDRETLERYRDRVFATADFMASYAPWDEPAKRYVLGPPLIPAQECYDPKSTMNPTFELQYWAWGLETAQQWRERLGLARDAGWDHVIRHLSPLPVGDGVYQPVEGVGRRRDHPSLLAACGVLSGSMVDRETMRRTLRMVMKDWDWESGWGWDFPMTAMTAARVGEPEWAIDALMMESPKNRYLPNGHNYQSRDLPLYLPGNGGLLTAVAMMAAGWDGAPPKASPGFPDNGRWRVRWDHLRTMP